jgi:hypothetical protein
VVSADGFSICNVYHGSVLRTILGWQSARAVFTFVRGGRTKISNINYDEAASFSAYVVGVYDSRRTEFCTPPNTTVRQVTAVVAKFLNNHPEVWNQDAALLVHRALKEVFPCRNKQQ